MELIFLAGEYFINLKRKLSIWKKNLNEERKEIYRKLEKISSHLERKFWEN